MSVCERFRAFQKGPDMSPENIHAGALGDIQTGKTKSSATTQAAPAGPSVLMPPGATMPQTPLSPAAYVLRGNTANFDVSYDPALGANGPALADAILAHCEQDLAELRNFFGGVTTGRFSIFIDPGTFGAYHDSCPATTIHCAAYSGSGDLVNFLNCAEVDEVLMAAQRKGWNCGSSAGEGLSRVLATELHPASLGQFETASSWLNSARQDWVSLPEPTDRDYVSIGCATLFINYLRYWLGFSLAQIVQAGGLTLQGTYDALTGSLDAFGPFAALMDSLFPPGVPVNLATDIPFTFDDVPDVLLQSANGAGRVVEMKGFVPNYTGASPVNSFVKSQSPNPGTVLARGRVVTMFLVHGETP
jgi:hypothetical protein